MKATSIMQGRERRKVVSPWQSSEETNNHSYTLKEQIGTYIHPSFSLPADHEVATLALPCQFFFLLEN